MADHDDWLEDSDTNSSSTPSNRKNESASSESSDLLAHQRQMETLGEREGVILGKTRGERDGYAAGFQTELRQGLAWGAVFGEAKLLLGEFDFVKSASGKPDSLAELKRTYESAWGAVAAGRQGAEAREAMTRLEKVLSIVRGE